MKRSRPSRARLGAMVGAISLALVCGACGHGASNSVGGHVPAASNAPTSVPAGSIKVTTTTQQSISPVGGKVTVLEIGDSLGIDLGWGMQWALNGDTSVNLIQDAYGDSGLARPDFYNWPAVLESDLQADHPQIVVIFLGANDEQGLTNADGTLAASYGGSTWETDYAQRVSEMMTEATSAGARVLWVGMPIMATQSFSAEMQQLDAIYEQEAANHRGVTYYSSWNLFTTSDGQFNGGTTDITGQPEPLRDNDGIHLATGGEDVLGSAVVTEMKSIYKLP